MGTTALSVADQKRALRAQMREVLGRGCGAPGSGVAGTRAVSLLARAEAFRSASRVALFASLPEEIPTRPLFQAAQRQGKSVVFPRSLSEGRLEFAPVDAWEELVSGRYGVLEPRPGLVTVPIDSADLVVVPGLAFDRSGGRLGRGGGFYDRSLSQAARPMEATDGRPWVVGLAFEVQLVSRVPMEATDRPVDAVVTDAGFHLAGAAADAKD